MKGLLLFLAIIIYSISVDAQCTISVSSSPTSPMCGGCVTLYAYGSGTGNVAFQEDFNSGSPSGWSFTQTADYSNPCSPSGVDGTPHMWMGDASDNPRDMETVPLDLAQGGTICFDMLFSTQGDAAPCEGPDEPDEGVYLQYSTDNGATWVTIEYFDPNGGNDPDLVNWNNWCFELPPGALTTSTMIRWHQDDVTGPEYDHWGIDNVTIILNDPNYEITWLHDGYAYGQGNGGGPNPNPVCLTNDSTFTAQVSDGTNTCTASVTVAVTLPDVQVNAGGDTAICAGQCVDLSGQTKVVVSPASTPTFENNEFAVVGSGNAGININVQGLNTTSMTSSSITQVCINGFDFSGSQFCSSLSGCDCNGTPISFGDQCDLDASSFDVWLHSPNGCTILLVPKGVASGTSYQDVCFIPAGGADINSGGFPSPGSWNPNEPFDGMNGCNPNGVWELEFDAPGGLGFGIGTLFGWSISFDDPEISYVPDFTWAPTTNMTNETSLSPNVCPSGDMTYTLTASDTAGCVTMSDDVNITILPSCCPLQLDNVNNTDPSCGLSNGEIEILASGNNGTMEYSIDGTNYQTGNIFSNLPAGPYTVIVRDLDCADTTTVILTDQPGPSIGNINSTDPNCGANDGSIDITASGGNGSLTYSIDGGSTSQATGSFLNLGAGSYNIIVTDALGCQSTGSVSLNNASAPTITAVNVTQTTCGTANGSIDISVSGGTGTINYSIDNGTTFQTTGNFPGLSDGTYNIVVEDANGCSSSDQAILDPSSAPVFTDVAMIDPSCGVSDGTITIQAGDGTSPYTFSIDGGTTSQSGSFFSGLSAGSYPLQIEDALGCTVDSTVSLSSANGPTVDNVVVSDADCSFTNGQIDITASGGSGTLQYSVNGGVSFQSGTTFTNLSSGNYDIVVEDQNGCQATSTASINNFPGPSIDNVVTVDPSCGNNDGEIHIGATGNPVLLFSIDNGANYSNDTAYLSLPVGTYDILVVDGNGCQAADQVTLNNIAAPTIDNLIVSHPVCGQSNGQISIQASGTPTLQYSVNGGGLGSNPTFTGLGAGNYAILVVDGNGCQASAQQTLSFVSGPVFDSVVVTEPLCAGGMDGFINAYVDGGTPPYTYSLDDVTYQSTNMFGGLAAGNYTVYAKDQNGCQDFTSVTITEPNALTMSFSTVNVSCYGSCDGSALAFPQGGTSANGAYTYQWSPAIAGTSDAQASNVCAGNYLLQVSDDNGCSVDTSFSIDTPVQLVIDSVIATNEICYQDCQGTIQVLSNGSMFSIDGGSTFQTSSQFDSLCPGNYNVVVMDQAGCTTSDAARVLAEGELIADFTFAPTELTAFDTYVEFTNLSEEGISFNWLFGGIGASNLENPTYSFPEGQAGIYNVCLTIINANGCQAAICKEIKVKPEFYIYVPNAFTPDGDGDNDEFFADGIGLMDVKFEMQIFDRWGKLFFESNSAAYHWDGTINGKPAPQDVYVWKIIIDRPETVGNEFYRGHVTLVR